jgi:hypothetical protein
MNRSANLHRIATSCALSVVCAIIPIANAATPANQTEQIYLSGHGPKDAVPWEFSVTGGMRAGQRTTIPVPSNWEQQGFGGYNYGEPPQPKFNEHGLYRLRFTVPPTWNGRRVRLVFEGVMTDATVLVNGKSAGPVHQGAFYRFSYDVTSLVKLGAGNVLDVDVAKVSANPGTEGAERTGDFWVFGGIYRPVYLESVPAQNIERTAIDAKADGSFAADVFLGSGIAAGQVSAQILDAQNQPVGAPFSADVAAGAEKISLHTQVANPALWTAETPNLYSVRLALRHGSQELHVVTQRFGFRTFELRAGQGFFFNGKRIFLKGVGRHSFRPATARALTTEDCYDDARLIKAMNMNAVRMTHYPPDVAFLEACDELGLYVLDELSGWHKKHDTENGRTLVREMVTRDVNHPCILFWDNGNEGGWNTALDGEFANWDPQNRAVLHPWATMSGVNTKHYPSYDDLQKMLAGPNFVMPTEMLHGLYDGGAGSGLEDYWKAITSSPYGGGGFIWVFADDGIVRTDQGGRVDVFSTYAPDGILGPNHEKEGSFYTIRDVYSPVQIDTPMLDGKFTGRLAVRNAYDFVSLARCSFQWKLLRFPSPADKTTAPTILASGAATAPEIAAHASGEMNLPLPENWREADAVAVVATDAAKQELWTWTWPVASQPKRADTAPGAATPQIETAAGEIRLRAGLVTASFDASTGLLRGIRNGKIISVLTNGPRLAFAHPPTKDDTQWVDLPKSLPGSNSPFVALLPAAQLANVLNIEFDYPKDVPFVAFKLEISPDGRTWKTLFNASRRKIDGKDYEFPPQTVAAVRLSNIRLSDGGAVKLKTLRAGYAAARFSAAPTAPAKVVTGSGLDAQTGAPSVWLDSTGGGGLDHFRWTLLANGDLRLDYAYSLDGTFSYHGITFDHPEEKMTALRWLGNGPYRVWQNRLRGATLGVHETARNDIQPGESWGYPEFQGFFSGLRWARLDTASGPLTLTSASPETYLRVGTPRISHGNTTVAFPAGDLSFMAAIPPMGSKFKTTEQSGPASQWAKASGSYSGTLTFHFGD